ncbi:MAG: asparagine--tRNA ligase [Gammaproteobacteria bacterium]|nr:asparagine--tRNA ligase [Gammaproteobacteria bacterium]
MTPHSIRAILRHEIPPGSEVCIEGWVRSRRSSRGGFSFVQVHDGSCFDGLQAVVDAALPNYASEVEALGAGCAVRITGQLVESRGRHQDREIQASAVEVLGWVEDPETYPIAKKRHTFEYLRTVAHLRPRTNTFGAIARVRNSIAQAVHGYFREHGFLWVNTPIITANDCEGAGALFRVSTLDALNRDTQFGEDFFGEETWLTVSGQLNVESYACSLSRVYTFGPTFRAENSNTSRHLAEFWMIEPEIAFADLDDLADLAEDFLKCVSREVLGACADDVRFFEQRIDPDTIARLKQVTDKEFVRMDYSDAIKALEGSGRRFEFPVEWGLDLQTEHERWLTEEYARGPVVVMNYPKSIKAFYMRLNDDGQTVAAMDVLVPGVGEIVGGSQREERLAVLDARLAEHGLGEELWWYRDLRRYGTVPHAGFGLGLERLVLYMTGMDNIRDAIPFPRTPGNATF